MIIITPPRRGILKNIAKETFHDQYLVLSSHLQAHQEDLEFLSITFPRSTRSQLVALRSVLNDQKAPWRTYAHGLVSITKDAMLKEVAFKCSPRTADRMSLLLDRGVCLQAVATTPLKIPMVGTEPISLRL